MRIKKIKLKNIRSYDEVEIEFPKGSTLLSGDIGCGKTSILLAIEYALFGLQPGQRGSSLLSNGKESGSVILEFEVNGLEVVVERILKRGTKSISQDYAAITINGQKTESSVTEIKTKVLELLNYPAEFIKKNNLLYRYTVYTPQEQMKQIILEDAESRLNILRHIFGIDKYKRIKENISNLTSKLREESRILQLEVRDLDESKEKLETDKKFIKIIQGKINSKDGELEKLQSKRREIESEIEGVEKRVKEKENFKKEIEKTNIMLTNKIENLAEQEKSIKDIKNIISDIKELFNERDLQRTMEFLKEKNSIVDVLNKNYIEASSKINSLEIKKKEDLKKKNRIFKIDICPTCLQDVSEVHKCNILNETERLLRESEEQGKKLHEQLRKTEENLENEKKAIFDLQERKSELEILRVKTEEINSSREKLEILIKSKENLIKDVNFLEDHIDALKKSTLEFTKFDNILKIKEDDLKKAFQDEKYAEIEIAELRKEVEITKKEIEGLEKKIKETEVVKEKLISILDIEKWLSSEFSELINFTEKNIMLTLRNEFSKLFNKWFSMLTTDSFYVHLDENFTPIITQGEFELDYAYLSGGERTAVALAYRLALNQVLNSLLSKIKTQDIVILDEPTDGFSDQQLDRMRDIFQELNVNQLILVSHEPKIESFVENIIRLKKQGGKSRIE